MRPALAVLFSLVVLVMAAHEAEHVAQVVQKDVIAASCPNDCRGLLGFVFDVEWVHAAYNHSLLAALVALYAAFGLWRRSWRERRWAWASLTLGIFVVQGYHVVEHSVKLEQWLENGHRSPTPGILGRHFSLVELHFGINTLVFALVVAGYVGFGLHRYLWQLRTPRRVAFAGALVAVSGVAIAATWTQRPPTVRLAAGVHEGPLHLTRAQRLVGEPGAIVRGGIVVTADDVVVRDVTVVGGEHGISVDGAESVLLERVSVARPDLDGINVRRGSVTVRRCRIDAGRKPYVQGIDISFSFDMPPSVVDGCVVRGGWEGIVSHFAHVRVSDNTVTATRLRAITVTEMSVGTVERNSVEDALGVGIFCGDYSQCKITRNSVAGTRADRASSDRTRLGYAIQAHFGAVARISRNDVGPNPFAAGAFANARIERG